MMNINNIMNMICLSERCKYTWKSRKKKKKPKSCPKCKTYNIIKQEVKQE